MGKSEKMILITVLAAVAALALLWFAQYWFSGCGGADADLVFVSDTDTPIGSVGVDTEMGNGMINTEVGQYADNSLLKRGESFGFEVDGYPVTVTAYGAAGGKVRLASCVVEQAPVDGERWYVVARDGENGMVLEVGSQWPGVE